MEQLLRLKTFPVAFKLLENREDLAAIPFMRRLGHKSTLCQLINLVRSFDWTVGADDTDMVGPMCTSIVGLTDSITAALCSFAKAAWETSASRTDRACALAARS
jgi:uncharacterized protein (DUF169 family)